MSKPVEIFIAYSREDSQMLTELRRHFTPLERDRRVRVWYDGKIEPGDVWEESIKRHLHGADIVLLLVSADSIASDYFYDKEVADALERHRAGTARVVPLILRPCVWRTTPLGELQALPQNGKPVTEWASRDAAYTNAVEALWQMIEQLESDHKEKEAAERRAREAADADRQAADRRKQEAARRQTEAAEQQRQQAKQQEARREQDRRDAYQYQISTAEKHLARRRWQQAAEAARAALTIMPDDGNARRLLEQAEAGSREPAVVTPPYGKWAGMGVVGLLLVFLLVKISGSSSGGATAAWEITRKADSKTAYEAFISKYGDSPYAQDARDRIAAIEDAASDKLTADKPNADKPNADKPTESKPAVYNEPAAPPSPNRSAAIQKLETDMVSVTGGTFTMGWQSGRDGSGDSDEKPAHDVTLRNFSIGRYEVTQAQWRAVMGSDPPELYNKGCDQCPVERVSWNDIQDFLKKLNSLTGKRYRLPTEAEWEYAARGGNQSNDYLYSGGNDIGAVAWYDGNTQSTRPVGGKKANELGLYDMSGNVYEWCEDDWHGNYQGAPTDGRAWVDSPRGSYRVFRGGGWRSLAEYCRAATRYNPPTIRNYSVGFRLALQ